MYTEGVLVKAVDSWRLSAVLHRKREKREKSMVGGREGLRRRSFYIENQAGASFGTKF